MSASTEICGHCGTSSDNLQRCSRCHLVLYCSKNHQIAHWKIHKKECNKIPTDKSFNCSSHVINGDNRKSKLSLEELSSSINAASIGKTNQRSGNKSATGIVDEASAVDEASFSSMNQQQCQPDMSSVPNPLNGTFSDPSNLSGGKVTNKRRDKKNKSTARVNSSLSNSNLPKNDEENLENHSPSYPLGRMRPNNNTIVSPPINTSGVNVINPKTTPVAASPLLSTSSAVNSSPDPTNQDVLMSHKDISIPFFHRNSLPSRNLAPQQCESSVLQICQQVIADMERYGICVVDNLLGRDRGELVYNEVQSLYTSGSFKDGQLVKEQKDGASAGSQAIRSDKITWVDGSEPTCENISFLISLIDSIVLSANKLRDNGKLGNYNIKERTKAMIACYPGDGSHYVKHVDNPNQDGRCVTSIYYLNKDWNSKEFGGLLRIFPEGWTNQVADIEPLFDRVLFFWSDRRNPHEVRPAYRTRYAITLWYFDAKEKDAARDRREQPQQLS